MNKRSKLGVYAGVANIFLLINGYSFAGKHKSICVNEAMVEKNKDAFRKFIWQTEKDVEKARKLKNINNSWLGILSKPLVSVGSFFTGYTSEDIENTATMNRYF
ncbi:MAG TPA: hypothetical protein VEK38_03110, partial [Candidatus Bathyarchaeia archaeon]|nr:hypothetical protein [Candidatus Bathyarchaeia archaeon]